MEIKTQYDPLIAKYNPNGLYRPIIKSTISWEEYYKSNKDRIDKLCKGD